MSSGFRCDVCAVFVNSESQYNAHKNGKSHLKKLTLLGLPEPELETHTPRVYGGKFVAASTMIPTTEGYVIDPVTQNNRTTAPNNSNMQTVTSVSNRAATRVITPRSAVNSATFRQSVPSSAVHRQTNSASLRFNTAAVTVGSNDPVAKAVIDNMMGDLPLKRKLYSGTCDVCGLAFNSESQEQQHLSGGKHAKKLRMSNSGQIADTITLPPATFTCNFCNLTMNSQEQIDQHRAGSKHAKRVTEARLRQTEAQNNLVAAITPSSAASTTSTTLDNTLSNFVPPPLTLSS